MKIELFHSPGCAQCAAVRASLKAIAQELVQDLDWQELNVVEKLDRAVDLGVLTLPAIAIDGELVFASLPTPQQLRAALTERLAQEK